MKNCLLKKNNKYIVYCFFILLFLPPHGQYIYFNIILNIIAVFALKSNNFFRYTHQNKPSTGFATWSFLFFKRIKTGGFLESLYLKRFFYTLKEVWIGSSIILLIFIILYSSFPSMEFPLTSSFSIICNVTTNLILLPILKPSAIFFIKPLS